MQLGVSLDEKLEMLLSHISPFEEDLLILSVALLLEPAVSE